jgi:hypothetical protein
MKTDDLIRSLTADGEHSAVPFHAAMSAALIGGLAASALIFAFWMGPRPDFADAVATIRFPFKVSIVALLAVAAFGLTTRSGRPGATLLPWISLALAAFALLIVGVVAELIALPSNTWLANLNGSNRMFCLIVIPALSAIPLVSALIGLRYGAPSRPALAGAAAGLAAGAIAATLYALNCNNDSPLFVVTWYPMAIGFVVLMGAAAGSRLLRW